MQVRKLWITFFVIVCVSVSVSAYTEWFNDDELIIKFNDTKGIDLTNSTAYIDIVNELVDLKQIYAVADFDNESDNISVLYDTNFIKISGGDGNVSVDSTIYNSSPNSVWVNSAAYISGLFFNMTSAKEYYYEFKIWDDTVNVPNFYTSAYSNISSSTTQDNEANNSIVLIKHSGGNWNYRCAGDDTDTSIGMTNVNEVWYHVKVLANNTERNWTAWLYDGTDNVTGTKCGYTNSSANYVGFETKADSNVHIDDLLIYNASYQNNATVIVESFSRSNNINSVIVNASYTVTDNSNVTFKISCNSGDDWADALNGSSTSCPVVGSDFKLLANLTGNPVFTSTIYNISVKTVNTSLTIFNNRTFSIPEHLTPLYLDNASLQVDVTSDAAILSVNITVTSPNGTQVLDSYNMSSDGGNTFNSTNFYVSTEGLWKVGVNVTDFNNNKANVTWDFNVVDAAPVLGNTTIFPTSVAITDNLSCSLNWTDAENNSVTQFFQWYKNSIENASLTAQTVGLGNTTAVDIWVCEGWVNDSLKQSSKINSSNMTIADSATPTITNATTSSETATNGDSVDFYANCTDADTAIEWVYFYIVDPDDIGTNYSVTTADSGDVYKKSLTLTKNGVWNYSKAFCKDLSGNIGENGTVDVTVTVSALPVTGPGGGPGGGAAPTIVVTEEINVTEELLNITCGNGRCDEWEHPFNCQQDCLNFDVIVSGDIAQFGWFPRYIIIGLLATFFIWTFFGKAQRKKYFKTFRTRGSLYLILIFALAFSVSAAYSEKASDYLLYDDFEDGTIDTSIWYINGTVTEENGVLNISGNRSNEVVDGSIFRSIANWSDNITMEFNISTSNLTTTDTFYFGFNNHTTQGATDKYHDIKSGATTDLLHFIKDAAASPDIEMQVNTTSLSGNATTFQIHLNASAADVYLWRKVADGTWAEEAIHTSSFSTWERMVFATVQQGGSSLNFHKIMVWNGTPDNRPEADIIQPTPWTNVVNNTLISNGDDVRFNATWEDDEGLSSFVFSHNISGSWVNESYNSSFADGNASLFYWNVNKSGNTVVAWIFYANDTTDNWNQTVLANFTVDYVLPPGVFYILEPFAIGLESYLNNTGVHLNIIDDVERKERIDIIANTTDVYCKYYNVSTSVIDYSWYRNELPLDYNLSSISNGNYSKGDYLECGVLAADEKLLLYLDFDNNDTSDLSSYNNDANDNGSEFARPSYITSGKVGGAYTFDGVDDGLNISWKDSLNFHNRDVSIEAWIKPNVITTDGETFLEHHNSSLGGNEAWSLSIRGGNYNGIYFRTRSSGSGIDLKPSANLNSTLLDGGWHQVVVTIPNDLVGLKMYIDGTDVTSGATDHSLNSLDTSVNKYDIWIGKYGRPIELISFFNGSVDEVSFWNRTLTATEVLEHYEHGVKKYSSHRLIIDSVEDDWGYNTNLNFTNQTGNVTLHSPIKIDDTVLLLNFDGNSTNDSSTYGNDADYNGSEFARPSYIISGKIGGAYSFDNMSKQYFNITHDESINFNTESYSVSVWFKSTTRNDQSILEKWAGPSANPYPYVIRGPDSVGQIKFNIYDGTNNPGNVYDGDYDDGEWHHVVGVRDTVLDQLLLYIDGVLVDSDTDSTTGDINNTLDLFIGARNKIYGFFNGSIDEVRILNRTLTADEVLQDYKDQSAGKQLKIADYEGDGNMTSDIFDLGIHGNRTTTLSWGEQYCYGKEMRDCPSDNMTDLIALYHFGFNNTNDSAGTYYGVQNSTNCTGVDNGKFKGACDFDGHDSKIDTGKEFVGKNATTISAWIYLDSFGEGGLGRIIDNGKMILLVNDTNDSIEFTSDGLTTTAYSATNSIFTSQWYHILVTRDASGTANIYVNAELSGPADQASGTPAAGTTNLIIGNRNNSGDFDRTFNGTIDEVIIWNKTLPLKEIQNLYRRGVNRLSFQIRTGELYDIERKNDDELVFGWHDGIKDYVNSLVGDAYGNFTNGMGYLGRGGVFNGVDSYFIFPDSDDLDFGTATDFSISFWMRRARSGAVEVLLDKRESETVGYGIYFASDNKLNLKGTVDTFESTSTITDTNWHHIVYSIDRDSGRKLFIDGSEDKSDSTATTNDLTNTNDFIVGRVYNTVLYLFSGSIDEIHVWKRALTADEVKTLYDGYQWSWFAGEDYVKKCDGDSDCVLAFDFSEGVGNKIYDESNSLNNGTVYGANWTGGGYHGSALNFDGVDDYVNINDDTSLNISNITVAAWINTRGDTGTTQIIVSKETFNNYELMLVSPTEPRFYTGGTDTEDGAAWGSDLDADTWYHIVGVHDGTTTKIYVNGIRGTDATTPTSPTRVLGNVTIGSRAKTSRYFNGRIDSVMIYNRSLSAEEVYNLYLDKIDNNTGSYVGDANRYIQYRAFLETDDTNMTPVLSEVLLKQEEYENVVLNTRPYSNFSLSEPLNNSYTNDNSSLFFNWTNQSDLDNDILYTDFQLANDTNFTSKGLVANLTIYSYSNFTWNLSELVDDIYYWRVRSNDFDDVSEPNERSVSDWSGYWHFILDSSAEDLDVYSPPNNPSFYSFDINNIILFNFTCIDTNLWGCQVNVTNVSYAIFFNYTIIDITNNKTYNISINKNFSGWKEANYTAEFCMADRSSASPPIPNLNANPQAAPDTQKKLRFSDSIIGEDFTATFEVLNPPLNPVTLNNKNFEWDITSQTNTQGIQEHIKYGGCLDKLTNTQKMRITYTSNNGQQIIDSTPYDNHTAHFIIGDKFVHHDDIAEQGYNINYELVNNQFIVTFWKTSYTKDRTCFDPLIGGLNSICENRTIVVDNTVPAINFSYPTINTTTTSTLLTIRYNVSDPYINNCTLYVNNALNRTNTSITNNAVQTFDYTFPTQAAYTFYINCSDKASNKKQSTKRKMTYETVTGEAGPGSPGGPPAVTPGLIMCQPGYVRLANGTCMPTEEAELITEEIFNIDPEFEGDTAASEALEDILEKTGLDKVIPESLSQTLGNMLNSLWNMARTIGKRIWPSHPTAGFTFLCLAVYIIQGWWTDRRLKQIKKTKPPTTRTVRRVIR